MAQLSRMGDVNQVGGKIIRGAGTVYCNGIQVGLHVSPITPHPPYTMPHKIAKTVSGSPTVFAEGCPVLRTGSADTCGHTTVQGSADVFCP